MNQGPITVDIAELALHGFDDLSAAEFDAQLRSQIASILSEQGPPDTWTDGRGPSGQPRSISSLSVTVGANDSPAHIAARVATALVASGRTSEAAPGPGTGEHTGGR